MSRFLKEIPKEYFFTEMKDRSIEVPQSQVYAQAKQSFKTKAFEMSKPMQQFGVKSGNELDYEVGDRVRHIKFGEGLVTNIVEGGRDFEVTVEFVNVGVKKMFAAFAKLKKID